MPRLSVIVAVHNVDKLVRHALVSATEQFGDLEVIAVDDGSTDETPQVLAEMASHDGRVQVVTLSERVGPSGARNAGLERAVGDYVLFLDADDWLEGGSLAGLVGQMEETSADVVVFDHAGVSLSGRIVESQMAEVLASAPSGAFALADFPAVLTARPEVWNKLYRRPFLDQHGLRFEEGFYEGIPWSYATLLLATRVAVLPAVCYYHRERRPGSALAAASAEHFDALNQWDSVCRFIGEHPQLHRWRGSVFDQMTAWLLAMARGRTASLTPRQRQRFFDEVTTLAKRHLPEGHLSASDVQGREQQLLLAGDPVVLQPRPAARRRIGSALKPLKRPARRVVRKANVSRRRVSNWAQRRRPLDESLVVLAAPRSAPGGGGPGQVARQLERLMPGQHHFVWLLPSSATDVGTQPGMPTVIAGSQEAERVLSTAGHVMYEGLFPLNMVKRPGQMVVHSIHSPPLKRTGVDLTAYPVVAERMKFRRLLAECDRWDVVLSPGQHASEVWQRAYPSSYRIMETGAPRLDIYRQDPERVRTATRKALGVDDTATVVLYAPTSRDYLRRWTLPTELDRLARALPEGFVLAVRPPPAATWDHAVAPLAQSGRALDASRLAVEHACLAADVMVTDYSSIMFDFAILDRPIVILAEDMATFDRVRGTYIDLQAHGPGPVVTDIDALAAVLVQGRHSTEAADGLRRKFVQRYCGPSDGGAAERAVRMLFMAEETAAPTWSTQGGETAAPQAVSPQ